jgi:integrase
LKRDATALDQELKRAKRLGHLEQFEAAEKTFEQLSEEWWKRHARSKAEKTQKNYAWCLDSYLIPAFGGQKLGTIRTPDIEEWMEDLADDLIGVEARRKALKLFRQILDKAIAWGEMGSNPASFVEMPLARRMLVEPPEVLEVERIRAALLAKGRMQDAVLVSLMAYAGLRPHEALELLWSDIQGRNIRVRAMKKVGARGRSVRLLKPLAADLSQLKLKRSRNALVMINGRGGQWTPTTFNNWRRRTFKRVAPDQRPYNLRHTFVSLLIAEGARVPDVAKQAGHGPELCLRTYAHLWEEYEVAGSAEEAIRIARKQIQDDPPYEIRPAAEGA